MTIFSRSPASGLQRQPLEEASAAAAAALYLEQVLVRDAQHGAPRGRRRVPLHSGQGQLFQVFRQLLAQGGGVGLLVAAFRLLTMPSKVCSRSIGLPRSLRYWERDLGPAAAVSTRLLDLSGRLLERLLQSKP